jgi:hypothetical protein
MMKAANRNDMKNNSLLFLLLIPFFQNCSTGEKALKKGHYEQAFSLSTKYLTRHPSNDEAKNIFLAAYKETERLYQANIQRYRNENSPFKWESVLYQYQQLEKHEQSFKNCKACIQLLNFQPQSYATTIKQVKDLAAAERYEAGTESLRRKENRVVAHEAMNHFFKVKQLSQSYEDADAKLLLAKEYAVLRVVIEPVIDKERMSTDEYEYLQEEMEDEFFKNRSPHELIRFQNPEAVQNDSIPPHHALRIYFTRYTPLRESTGSTDTQVESTTKYKVGTRKINDTTTVDVMESVKGTLTTHYRKREASCQLEYEIIDLDNNCVLHRDWMSESAEWKDEWQTFSGDTRALNGTVITSSQSLFPDSDWSLFKDMSRSAAGRICHRIRNFYKTPLPVYACLPKTSR